MDLKAAIAAHEKTLDRYGDGWQQFRPFQQEFMARFPELFKGYRGGLSIGPGWWEPLGTCLQEIQELLKDYPGFVIRIQQIKEKFGGLRLFCLPYHQDGNTKPPPELRDKLHALTISVELQCSGRCEVCGEPGEPTSTGWIKTLCEKHAAMRQR